MIKTVIIDDDPGSRKAIFNILTNYCKEVAVAGEAGDVASGYKIIKRLRPDAVFLDIEMPDGNGFDLLELFDTVDFHVIFITAHNQYAIKAFEYSAIDYILKPVDPEKLLKAIKKLKNLSPKKNQSDERVRILLNNKNNVSKIALPTRNGYRFVKVKDIVRCEAENNYTHFYLQTNEKILVTRTLKDYENILQDNFFIRVHQSHLINVDYVEQYIKGDGGTAIMSDGSEVEISRRKKELFLSKMLG
jgi:two-component system LytT family response regulator